MKIDVVHAKDLPYSADDESTDGGRQRISEAFQRLPVQINGIALGTCGLGGLLFEVLKGFGVSIATASVAVAPLYVISTIMLAVALARTLSQLSGGDRGRSQLMHEVFTPATLSAHSCFLVAAILIPAPLVRAIGFVSTTADGTAEFLFGWIVFCYVLYAALMCLFFFLAYRVRLRPEPNWFPPTVGVCLFALGYGSLLSLAFEDPDEQALDKGLATYLLEVNFYSGVVMTIALLPIVAYRVFKNRDSVAYGASAAMMMAPCSFVGLAWCAVHDAAMNFAVLKTEFQLALDPFLLIGHGTIFAFSQLFFYLTLCAVWARRVDVLKEPFAPDWAAFSFPFASTGTLALKFAHLKEGSWWQDDSFLQVLQVYAQVFGCVLVVQISTVLIGISYRILSGLRCCRAQKIQYSSLNPSSVQAGAA